jgi:hypothetical protein
MTVESLVFLALGLVAVGLILKMAAAKTSSRKPDKGSNKPTAYEQLTAAAKSSATTPPSDPAGLRDAAPTAEMQVLGDSHAVAMAQILVSKGQVIEAVKVLHENAGYDMEKAVATVDSMGKKVYASD